MYKKESEHMFVQFAVDLMMSSHDKVKLRLCPPFAHRLPPVGKSDCGAFRLTNRRENDATFGVTIYLPFRFTGYFTKNTESLE